MFNEQSKRIHVSNERMALNSTIPSREGQSLCLIVLREHILRHFLHSPIKVMKGKVTTDHRKTEERHNVIPSKRGVRPISSFLELLNLEVPYPITDDDDHGAFTMKEKTQLLIQN